MALEEALLTHAAALNNLATVIGQAMSHIATRTGVGSADTARTPGRPRKPPTEPPAPSDVSAESLAPAESEALPVTYRQVRDAVLRVVSKKNPAAALSVLEKFGVKDARALPADKWAEAIKLLDAA